MSEASQGSETRLVESLSRLSRRHRIARKLIVAPSFSAGRELLRRLARIEGGWIGFEVTTLARMAQLLSLPRLEESGLAALDPFEQQALIDEAVDRALVSEGGVLGSLAEGVGFRGRVHGAVVALRTAGIGPRELDASRFGQWEKKLFLLRVLQRYERLLVERQRADSATLMHLALGTLEMAGGQKPPGLDAEVIALMPGLTTRGLPGRLLAGLAARGGKLLKTDPVVGLDVPEGVLWGRTGDPALGSYLFAPTDVPTEAPREEIDLFCAASVDAELRAVLRRVATSGARWDDVEIITTDPARYGSALHALAQRLKIPVSFGVGLPIGRTRTGRVVQAYLDWIEEGFQAHVIHRLLEAGDLRSTRSSTRHAPAALARRFRSLRIGWGRKRYRSQLREAISGIEALERRRKEPEASFDRRKERALEELRALRGILFPALKQTPAVPDRMDESGEPVSPAELARGLEAFLKSVPKGVGPDASARDEVSRILERVNATLHRRTHFRSAVSILRRHLDIRVRPELFGEDADGAGAPWASVGGALHLSDLAHGGYSGRRHTFLVGMDADRIPGGLGQDPVLLDADRRVLGPELATSSESLRERVYDFAALFARLRGRLTMSYSAWEATEARTVSPSPLLLQAYRFAERDTTKTFADLHARIGSVVGAIPPTDDVDLDGEDWWMRRLGSGAVLRRGVEAVRSRYAPLDRGLTAKAARWDGGPSAFHGVIEARPDRLDPRGSDAHVLSASRLESLGACPLRYLHSTVLRVYPPDDPELDPDAWLDPRARGSLLHNVFDATLRAAAERGLRPDDSAFEVLANESLDEGLGRLRHEIPSPGEGTLRREIAALREDVRSFVRMIREQSPHPSALELTFGMDDDDAVELELTGGTLRLRGAIDRVDQDLAGLHVVDYKTGMAYGYGQDVFRGGRRLQHAIYAHAAEQRLGVDVVDGQYHFPTRRGQNQHFSYSRPQLAPVGELLDVMLDGVAAGHFVPTNDSNDCTFCDYAEVCRVRRSDFGAIDSPMAAWSEEVMNVGLWPAFEHLKKARTFEE
ncbi:MAG: PD-(D/E)XK nuclease family protein [Gemmatimonadota bacterium]